MRKFQQKSVAMGRAVNESIGVGLTLLWFRIIRYPIKKFFYLLPYRNPNSEINKLVVSRFRLMKMFYPIIHEPLNLNEATRTYYLRKWERKLACNKLMFILMSTWFCISDIFRHKKNMDNVIFKVTLNCYDDSDLAYYINQRALFYGKTFGLIASILLGIILWMCIKSLQH